MKYLLLLILLAGIVVGIYLVIHPTQYFSKASSDVTPKDIKLSNISDNSFTVSWITPDKPSTGIVYWGLSVSLGQVSQDDRDEGVNKLRVTHHITLKKLDPQTSYYFKIGSASQTFDNKGKPYSQTTASITENPPSVPDPVFGKVITSTGVGSADSLVYLTVDGGSLLSSYTRDGGKWLITLNNSRTKDLVNYLNVNAKSTITLSISAGNEGTALTKVEYGDKDKLSMIKLNKISLSY